MLLDKVLSGNLYDLLCQLLLLFNTCVRIQVQIYIHSYIVVDRLKWGTSSPSPCISLLLGVLQENRLSAWCYWYYVIGTDLGRYATWYVLNLCVWASLGVIKVSVRSNTKKTATTSSYLFVLFSPLHTLNYIKWRLMVFLRWLWVLSARCFLERRLATMSPIWTCRIFPRALRRAWHSQIMSRGVLRLLRVFLSSAL